MDVKIYQLHSRNIMLSKSLNEKQNHVETELEREIDKRQSFAKLIPDD